MLLIFVLFMIGILFFIYWIPKKLGYPKVGKFLSIGLFVLLILIILYGVFQDAFFTKNQARELLVKQEIVLNDDFKILNNKTTMNIGSNYHRFRLEISENDKNKIIEKIKSVEGFISVDEEKLDLYSNLLDLKASKIIQYSEDTEMFLKEFFRPNHEGRPSSYFRIELEKSENTLVYEEIHE